MGSGRAKRFAAGAVAALLLAALTAVLVATAAPSPRPLKYACASNLYNAKRVLHYVARPSQCRGRGKKLVNFKADDPVYTCRKEHGGFVERQRQRRFQYPSGIRSHGPAGLMRWVSKLSDCAPASQPNETPITLPQSKPRIFCAAKRTRELRWVGKAKQCDRKEFPVRLGKSSGKPVAGDDSASTDEASSTDVSVLANDKNTPSSSSNSGLSVDSVDTSGMTGVATVNPDDTVKYDPAGHFESLNVGQTATDSFKYRAKKGSRTSNAATVTVTISGINDAPVLSGIESTKLNYPEGTNPGPAVSPGISVADVDNANIHGGTVKIGSGFDSGQDHLDFSNQNGITGSYNSGTGVLTLTGSASKANYQAALRSVKFRSSGGALGDRTVSFQVEDGSAANKNSNVVSRKVDVDKAPVASDDSKTLDEDAGATSIDVLANDSDGGDGGPKTIVSKTNGTHGTVAVTGGGSGLTYTPAANYCGSDSFTYTLNGGSTGTVSITVTCVDDPPVASNDSDTVAEDSGATAIDVLTNDSDGGDGGLKEITGKTDGAHGTVALTGGTPGHHTGLTYQPAADYCGPDSFTYTLNGGSSGTVSITVTCTNDAPVTDLNGTGTAGFDTTASFTEDSPAASVAPNADVTDDSASLASATITLTNHPNGAAESLAVTIPGGNPVTASSYDSGTGVLTLTGNGASPAQMQAVIRSLKYDNSSNTPSTTDRSVTVKVNDGALDSNVATSVVSVAAHNDAPTATDQTGAGTVSGTEDTPSPITLAGTDPEGDSLTFTHDANSANGGTITGVGASVTYNPDGNFCGTDSFGFEVDDGNGGTDTGTVNISVACQNDAPVTDLDSTVASFDTTASFTEDSPAVNVAPNAAATDGDSASLASATITLTNHPNGAAESLAVTIPGGNPITTTGYNNGTGVLTLTGNGATPAQFTAVLGSLKYNNTSNTPDTTDRVVNVKVNDGALDSNEPHSTITINPNNDAPVANNQSGLSTNEEAPLPITLTGSDPEGSGITFAADQPSDGSVSPTNSSSVTYTPDADFCGSDSFTFHTNDGTSNSPNGTVSITVNCLNDRPVVDLNAGGAGIDQTNSFTEGAGAVNLAPTTTVTDVDNANLASAEVKLTNIPNTTAESLAVTIPVGNPVMASSYDSGTGVLTLTGPATKAQFQAVIQSVTYNNTSQNPDTADRIIQFKANDGSLDNSPVAKVTLSVSRTNDAPTADGQTGLTTGEDTALPITLTGGDVDGDSITFHSDQPSDGSVSPTTGSSVSYTPDQDFCGTDSFTFHTNDGTVDSANATISITVTCANDKPVVDLNGAGAGNGNSVSFAEQLTHTGGDVPLAPNGTVADVDDTHLESLTVTLQSHPNGSSEVLSASTTGTTGITVDAYDSGSGVLLIHGHATKANYQTVLRSVKYRNDAAPPDPTTRSVTFVANDGDIDSDTQTATVTVVPINAQPVLDLDSGTLGFDSTASFTENSPAVALAPAPTVTDADDTDMTSATVTLTDRPDGGAESLSATGTGTITVDAYVPGTGVLFIHGTGTKAQYETVLASVKYDNTDDTPTTTPRNVTFTVNDGQDNSNTANSVVSVAATNDPPTATDQTGASKVTTNEDTPKSITLSGTDPENDTLTFTVGTGADAPQHGDLTGTPPGLTYTPDPDFCGDDSFKFTADDGNGGTDQGTVDITVTCANDKPVVDLNAGGSGINNTASFTEDGGAVTITPAATVSDVDNTTLASGTITLTDHPNDAAESLAVTIPGGNPITASLYDSGTGVLTLNGNGTATPADFQAVIQSVRYNNTSNTPDTTPRDVTFKVNDGAVDSDVAHSTVSVATANDAPTLDLNGGGGGVDETQTYTEDAPPVTLAPNTVADDVDDTHLESATVTLTNDFDGAAESLSVVTTGTSITPVAYDDTTGVLSLSGHDTVANYQQVLRTIKYVNTSQNPNATNRTVNFVVNDGSSNSNSPIATVTIVVVNDRPVVDMDGGGGGIDSGPVAFTEDSSPLVVGSGPVTLGASATVTDVDSATLQSMTLTLSPHPDGVNESLSVTIPGGNPINTTGYNSSNGELQLNGNGTATPANFQTVLQSAKYNNVSNTPTSTSRTVDIQANDGAASNNLNSPLAHTTITVTPTNDAPVADDETVSGAINNTTFVGDDPSDGAPSVTEARRVVNVDVLSGDTDPESPGTVDVVDAGTDGTNNQTADGGTVTIEADGDFVVTRNPSANCTDVQDSFLYTISDHNTTLSPGTAGTDTGAVTVNYTADCPWYVKNDAPTGPGNDDGASDSPFRTLNQAETASGADDYVFVYDGDNTSTGYTTGYTMNANEHLVGEAKDFVVNGINVDAQTIGAYPTLTATGEDVVDLTNNNDVGGLILNPSGAGSGIAGSPGDTGGGTIDQVLIHDTGVAGTQPGLELDGTTGTYTITGLDVDNNSATTPPSTATGIRLNNTAVDFGGSSIRTNNAKALDAASTNMNTSTFERIEAPGSTVGGVSMSGTTGTTQLGDGSGTDLALTTTSGTAPALKISNGGTVSVPGAGTANLTSSGGPAADITGTSGATFDLDTVTANTTGTSEDGINLAGLGSGSFVAAGGTLTGGSGIEFDLDGGNGTITYPGTFANATNGKNAEITGRTAGANSNVTFAGAINDSTAGAGGGITIGGAGGLGNSGGSTTFSNGTKKLDTGASDAVVLNNNTGHTVTFSNGGLDIDTTSGKGFEATGGGTVNVTSPANPSTNAIDTTSGKALNVTSTNVGASPLSFEHISSNGANGGILLSSTGSNDALTVTSTGSGTCDNSSSAGCSGGTIQNTTGGDDAGVSGAGTGIALNSTKGVSLTRMHLANHTNYAIRGASVTGGFTLANSLINGTNGTNDAGSFQDSSIRFTELTGSNAINNSAISGGWANNVRVENTAGSLNRLTLQSDNIGANSTTNGNDAVGISTTGTAVANMTVDSTTFTSSRGDIFGTSMNGASSDIVFTNNTVTNNHPGISTGGGGLSIFAGLGNDMTLNVSNNTMRDAVGNALILVHDVGDGSGTYTGTVNNNQIGVAGTANSGSFESRGIFLRVPGTTGATSVAITNNQVRQVNSNGIEVEAGSAGSGSSTGNIDATVTGNTVSNPGNNGAVVGPFQGIHLNSGTTPGQAFTVCMHVKANSIIGSGKDGGTDFRLRQRQSSTVRLPGYGGSATSNAAVTSFVQNQNDANPNSAGAEPPTPSGAVVIDSTGFAGGAACTSG